MKTSEEEREIVEKNFICGLAVFLIDLVYISTFSVFCGHAKWVFFVN